MATGSYTRRRVWQIRCLVITLLVAGCGRKEPPSNPDEASSDSAVTVESTTVAKESVETFFDDSGTRVDYKRLCSAAIDDSLIATVEASSSTYDLDEEVELVLRLRNTSEMVVAISTSNFPVVRCIFTAIHGESRGCRVFTHLQGVVSEIKAKTLIEPGATLEQSVSLPAGSVARNPVRREMQTGQYSLVVEYALGFPEEVVQSEIVDGREVTVPVGLVRAPAIDILIRE